MFSSMLKISLLLFHYVDPTGFFIIIIIIIHFIYRRLQRLISNILIQIDGEIHSYHKEKKINLNILDLL